MGFFKKSLLLPLIIAAVALLLRLYDVQNGIIFGYDQARDAYRVTSFSQDKNIMLLGPETDIPGVHHGVGYYYLLAVPYSLSKSPVVATCFFVFIHSLFVIFFYFSLLDIFKSKTAAFVTSILYAASFEMVQYSRWLSNPTLGVITMYLVWYFFVRYTRGDQKALLLSCLFAGLSVHFQLFLLYAAAFVFITPLFFRKVLRWGTYIKGIIIYCIFLIPFSIAELRFNGQLTKSFLNFFLNAKVYHGPIEIVIKIAARMESVISHLITPGYMYLAVILFIVSFIIVISEIRSSKTKHDIRYALVLLVVWHLLTYFVYVFSSGAVGTEFSFVGGVLSIIMIVGFAFTKLLSVDKLRIVAIFFLSAIVILNSYIVLTRASLGSYFFSVQQYLTYGLEKQIVDYVYEGAGKSKSFSVCTLTNPFYVNTTWAYVFSTYGKDTYGYVPYWAGSDQYSALGGKDLPKDTIKPALRYLIYEPPAGMPDYMPNYFRKIESYISTIVETKRFNEFIVEKRLLKPEEELELNSRNGNYKTELENGKLFSCYN